MKRYGVSRETTAPPDRVWHLWSDPLRWSAWNSGVATIELDRGFTTGSRGSMTTRRGSTHAVAITAIDAPHSFTLESAALPLARARYVCDVQPRASGTTIAQSVVFSGPLAFLLAPLFGPQIATNFVPVLDDLARAAESAWV